MNKYCNPALIYYFNCSPCNSHLVNNNLLLLYFTHQCYLFTYLFFLFQLWLSFAPIADLTAIYYNQNLDAINWLSIVFLICYLLFGLPTMWILDVLGLRTGVSVIVYLMSYFFYFVN